MAIDRVARRAAVRFVDRFALHRIAFRRFHRPHVAQRANESDNLPHTLVIQRHHGRHGTSSISNHGKNSCIPSSRFYTVKIRTELAAAVKSVAPGTLCCKNLLALRDIGCGQLVGR
jgi:hypothetical protein